MPDEGDRHWRRELTLSAHSILKPLAMFLQILSGTQIERLLQEIEVADTSPGTTKWKFRHSLTYCPVYGFKPCVIFTKDLTPELF